MPNVSEVVSVSELDQIVQGLIAQARYACKATGDFSSECVTAWDAVEEIQSAIADRRQQELSNFERYCQERPDGLECRVYDV